MSAAHAENGCHYPHPSRTSCPGCLTLEPAEPLAAQAELRAEREDRRIVLEGMVVDGEAGIERFCEAIVETTTEYDWRPGTPHSLPEHLCDGLRAWARAFVAWDRQERR